MKNINELEYFKNCYSDHIIDYLTGTLNKENLFYYIQNLIDNKKRIFIIFY